MRFVIVLRKEIEDQRGGTKTPWAALAPTAGLSRLRIQRTVTGKQAQYTQG